MSDADRISCCITGCRRTFKRSPDDPPETRSICGRHWRMGPKPVRERYTKLLRLYRKRETASIARLIELTWQRNLAAIEDALAGKINDADLTAFLETI